MSLRIEHFTKRYTKLTYEYKGNFFARENMIFQYLRNCGRVKNRGPHSILWPGAPSDLKTALTVWCI